MERPASAPRAAASPSQTRPTATDPSSPKLRVVVATPLSTENCRRITELEPRIELVCDQDLYPPMRWPADFNGDPDFRRSPAQQARFEALIDSADALYGIPDVDPAALRRAADANSNLRWVQTMAAGGGGQVKAAGLNPEQLARIAFTTSAGVHAGPLVEFALFGLLAGAKDLTRLRQQQKAHNWSGRWEMRQLSEMTVLVAGLGGIGAELAQRLSALGARVIGTSRSSRPMPGVDQLIPPDQIPQVAGQVDAIVSTLPGTAATENLLGEAVFSQVRPGTILVSVGRGTVIDEAALARALADGRIGFAALDVFATEPLPTESPLWDAPNVLVSPHTAALNSAEDRLIAELFARNATRLLDGLDLINRVDTVDFY